MKNRETFFLAAVLAGIAAMSVILYLAARPQEREDSLQPLLPSDVRAALEGETRITSSQGGKLAWTMSCKGLVFHEEEGMVGVEAPTALIPMEDGGTVEVRGERGQYYQKSEDIELLSGVTVALDQSGDRRWVLHGDSASYRRGEDAFYLSGLSGVMKMEAGDTVRVAGRSARFDVKSRNMTLNRDVVCRLEKGVTLETDRLDYNINSRIASTDSPVRVRGRGYDLTGSGLRADMGSNKVEIRGRVTLRLEQGMGGSR